MPISDGVAACSILYFSTVRWSPPRTDVAPPANSQVLIRCDLNVPLDGKTITDDTRIRASVETIKYLVEKGARVAVSDALVAFNVI